MKADIGDVVRVRGTFTDADGASINPTVVHVSIRQPSGKVDTYTYGTHVAVVRNSTGHYYYDLSVDAGGWWHYRWWSTGTGQAAGEKSVFVTKPKAVN